MEAVYVGNLGGSQVAPMSRTNSLPEAASELPGAICCASKRVHANPADVQVRLPWTQVGCGITASPYLSQNALEFRRSPSFSGLMSFALCFKRSWDT